MNIQSEPVWIHEQSSYSGQQLSADITCDVCVVGAGIAGLTTAYQLAREGRSVVILESMKQVASGESFSTTAHLSSVIDDRFTRVKSIRGESAVLLAHQSHHAAIKQIAAVVVEEQIACDFSWVDGYLFTGENDTTNLLAEEAQVCRDAGIEVELSNESLFSLFGSEPVLRFSGQAQFHPRKYLNGLAHAVLERGVQIYTDTRVEKIAGGAPASVETHNGFKVQAKAVVLATNAPLQGGIQINIRIAAYTTYAIAALISEDSIWPALYWDTDEPYHYIRTQAANDGQCWLIVGGEDHKTGQETDQLTRWAKLEAWMRARFPEAGLVQHRWNGQVFETPDGLALIGPDPGGAENIYIVTGDSGMGMTHGTIAGLLLPDLIAGRENDWKDLYSPSRFPLMSVGTVVREGINMASQMIDWVTSGDVSTTDEIDPGCGAIVRRGLRKLAIHRQDDGTLCAMSARCPHMGGIVRWNAADQTWECPLHGSRFSADGRVLHGPAMEDLKPVEVPESASLAGVP